MPIVYYYYQALGRIIVKAYLVRASNLLKVSLQMLQRKASVFPLSGSVVGSDCRGFDILNFKFE
jgi:hypothetical protein